MEEKGKKEEAKDGQGTSGEKENKEVDKVVDKVVDKEVEKSKPSGEKRKSCEERGEGSRRSTGTDRYDSFPKQWWSRGKICKVCKHKELRTLLRRLRESCTSLDKSLTLLLAELVKGQEGCHAPEVEGREDDGGGDGEDGEEDKDEEKKEVEKVANAESSPSTSQ